MEKKNLPTLELKKFIVFPWGFTSSPVCWLHSVSGCDHVTDVLCASCLIIDLLLRTTPWGRNRMPLSQVCRGRNQIRKVKHISRDHQAGKWRNHDLNNLVELKASHLPAPPIWSEHSTLPQDSQPLSLLLQGFLDSQPMPLGACTVVAFGDRELAGHGRCFHIILQPSAL